jgi:hypothetical protein
MISAGVTSAMAGVPASVTGLDGRLSAVRDVSGGT